MFESRTDHPIHHPLQHTKADMQKLHLCVAPTAQSITRCNRVSIGSADFFGTVAPTTQSITRCNKLAYY